MSTPQLAPEHAACRTWAHWWKPYDAHREGGMWVADLRCARCESHRLDTIDKRGEVIKRRYRMATGYLRKGAGPLTGQDKNQLRLHLITGGRA